MKREQTVQVAFRIPKSLLVQLDLQAERMTKEMPGLQFSRVDALRTILARAFNATGELARKPVAEKQNKISPQTNQGTRSKRGRPPIYGPEIIAKIISLTESGLTGVKIGSQLKIPSGAVYNLRARANVKRIAKTKLRPLNPETKAAVQSLLAKTSPKLKIVA